MYICLTFADVLYAACVLKIWIQYVAETCRSVQPNFVQLLEVNLVCRKQLHEMCETLTMD